MYQQLRQWRGPGHIILFSARPKQRNKAADDSGIDEGMILMLGDKEGHASVTGTDFNTSLQAAAEMEFPVDKLSVATTKDALKKMHAVHPHLVSAFSKTPGEHPPSAK